MALTAIEVYKYLPRTNCGDCRVPTCLAFAMKLVQKQASLEDCPHVGEEAKQALEGSSAPPMATVAIGQGEKTVSVGGETVLFRHEETFHHPCALAVTVDTALPPEQMAERIERIQAARYDRVGFLLGVDLLALRDAGNGRLAAGVQTALAHSDLPLVLISTDAEAMAEALEHCGGRRPLLYGATAENLEKMLGLAQQGDCPLVLRAEGLVELIELSQRASQAGWNKLLLDSGARKVADTLNHQTIVRRAALNKKFKPLGFPTVAVCSSPEPFGQMLEACTAVAKYASVVVTDLLEDEYLLPLVTARLNIYSDPQKPIQVEPGVHAVGEPTAQSPVLVTTNFSLTYYLVEGDVMTSKVPVHLLAVDTEGTSVMTAWAAGNFTAESIAEAVDKFALAEKVAQRTLILPGGVAVLKGKLEELSGWEVVVGPRESSAIPHFFRQRGLVPR